MELCYWLVGNLHGTTTAPEVYMSLQAKALSHIGLVPFKMDSAVSSTANATAGAIVERYQPQPPPTLIAFSHMDDIVVMAADWADVEWVGEMLSMFFRIVGPERLTCFRGLYVARSSSMLLLHGIPWIMDRLREYGLLNPDGTVNHSLTVKNPWMGEAFDSASPLLTGDRKSKAQNIKGTSSYMCYKFRPDCQPANLATCRHMANPTEQTLLWAERIWRYVAGTVRWVICVKKLKQSDIHVMMVAVKLRTLEPGSEVELWEAAHAQVFQDSGWTVPRSITGLAVCVFGVLVLSKGVLQTNVADSSTVAEIASLKTGVKEGVWTRIAAMEYLGMSEFANSDLLPIPIFGDNMGALKFGRERCVSSKLKHVPLSFYVCHEKSKSKEVSFHQILSRDNDADYWTKPHTTAEVDRHRSKWMYFWAAAPIGAASPSTSA